jgi:Helix-turn-helix domain
MPNNTKIIQDDTTPVWGASEIARETGLDRGAAYHLLNKGLLPATKIGRKWVSTRDQLRRALIGERE